MLTDFNLTTTLYFLFKRLPLLDMWTDTAIDKQHEQKPSAVGDDGQCQVSGKTQWADVHKVGGKVR